MKIIEPNKYGVIDINQLTHFEKTNDFKLPEDYKGFLIDNNGGVPEQPYMPGRRTPINYFFGIHAGPDYESLFWNIMTYQDRVPSWYMPIGSDIAGNLILISLWEGNYGLTCFWDHESESTGSADQHFDNLAFLATTFTDFTQSLTTEP